jgi:NAD(P)-dependent dehydrogenase (short-subunit alcohol dehydrogenase family)
MPARWRKKAGTIDVSFNAIGMEDVQGIPLLDMPLEDFMHPIIAGARTQFLTARAVARGWSSSRGASVPGPHFYRTTTKASGSSGSGSSSWAGPAAKLRAGATAFWSFT